MNRFTLPAITIFIAACGGASSGGGPSKEPAGPAASASAAPAETAAPKAEEPAPANTDSIPTACADGQADGICAPPKSFVQLLCGAYPKPEVALALFSKKSPYTRMYMNRNMEGWYTSGQQSTSAKLIFDEEVVILKHLKASKDGMVIGNGAQPYDVLRLDGVCSSVESEAITQKRPPSPKYALVPWQRLEKNVQDALIADSSIAAAEAARRKECKGTTSLGVVSPKCAGADDRLSKAIVDYVKNGGEVPWPKSTR
ncbi:MAG: hypothetical protein ABW133_10745 [Polyangiaceae bacterium]